MQNSPSSKKAGPRTDPRAIQDTSPLNILELYQLAQQQDIPVYWYAFRDPALESLVVELEGGGFAIALDPLKLGGLGDEKYKLAHELGHGLTGSLYRRYTPLDERGRNEVRADRWAIRHLLPFEALQSAIAGGITDQQELAEYFDLPQCLIDKAIAYYTGPGGRRFCESPDD